MYRKVGLELKDNSLITNTDPPLKILTIYKENIISYNYCNRAVVQDVMLLKTVREGN